MRITNCKVNHLENPIGYWMQKTVFSWITEEEEAKQTRLVVYQGKEVISDTGWGQWDSLGTEVKVKILPRTAYTWQVLGKAADGSITESEKQTFETGKREEEWRARWITCAKEETRLPVFWKEFSLPQEKTVCSARLYLCGLGVYEASLNGKRVGDELLAPGCNAYDQWLQAQTYDITELLAQKNRIEVLLGDGWYKGRFGFEGDCNYGDSLKLLGEIHVTYSDGSEYVLGTDETWSVGRSNLLFSGIYDGEQRDDTLAELPDAAVSLVTEQMLQPQDRLSVPVRVREAFPVTILHTPKGETVLDTGQNLAGIFQLRIHEPKGSRVRLQFGEVLQDGCFYRDNLRGAKAEYCYVSDGQEKILQPHFTFYGYRYVKVEGIPECKAKDFTALAVYSEIPQKGSMITGHEKVNQLISNTEWGMKSNFVGNPTDCPQRDERMGWTGDAQVFCETACYLADTYLFYQKYLYDMRQEQKKFDGMVPDVIPTFGYRKSCSVWGDAVCIIPWTLYRFYGDRTILEECYGAMKDWIRYIQKIDGTNHGWREVFHYGDWLALDSPYQGAAQTKGGTEEGFIADVYYRKSVRIAAKTAAILGFAEEAQQYEALAEWLHEEIQAEYFSQTGRCCIPTQTALLLTLTEGLHDPGKAAKMLKEQLIFRENKLTTGFVGTPLLCEGLTSCGMEETAFQILLNEEYPGWLYEVNLGATTIWERWNSLDEQGRISSTGMNSLNHYAYGAVTAWLWKDVAGIRWMEEAPGFCMAQICPHVAPELHEMHAVYPSAAGTYEVHWKIPAPDQIQIRICIPCGCSAYVTLPLFDAEKAQQENPLFQNSTEKGYLVSAGEYEVNYSPKEPIIKPKTVDELLRILMADSYTRPVLQQELGQLEHMIAFGAEYPLRETMTNLGYTEAEIEELNQKLIRKQIFL